jgi:hypothetical protein
MTTGTIDVAGRALNPDRDESRAVAPLVVT